MSTPLLIFCCFILAYSLGSIPSAVWIGRRFFGIDVRQHGSKSAGATNTIRVLGLKTGLLVLFLDALKGWLAVFVASRQHFAVSDEYLALIMTGVAAFAVLGHVFPVWAGFKGGKGVATLLGIAVALFPLEIAILLGIFAIMLLLFRYVSLASITAALCFPVVTYFIAGTTEIAYLVFALLTAVFVPLTHIKNIKRLIKGEESRFVVKKG